MCPFHAYSTRRHGRIFHFPSLEHPSWRFAAHPDGTGTDWEEDLDVDRPHGLDYRAWNHLAKAVRKRSDKEHEDFADTTVGGEHVPGFCQVLRQVDGTADISGAYDNTLFQANGIAHSSGNETLWCVTGAAGDPTVMLMDPDKQCKGADITWSGAAEFDQSVDMTGPFNVDGSAAVKAFDASDTQIDGTLTVLDRADVSILGAVDVSVSAGISVAGLLDVDATTAQFGGTAGIGLWFDPTAYAGGESVTFPNGLVFKGGYVADAGAATDVSFAVAFPSAILTVAVQQKLGSALAQTATITAIATTGFTISDLGIYTGYYWQAWGY